MALWNVEIREMLVYEFRNIQADSLREAVSIAEDMTRHANAGDSSHEAIRVDKIDRFVLGDDGSLDTVIIDKHTDKEHRFNYHPEFEGTYDDFVASCIEELESEVCE